MSEDGDSAEREHEPTERRLETAREKGDIARSADLNTAAAYAGFLLCAMTIGAASLKHLLNAAMSMLDQADTLAPLVLSGEAGTLGGLLGVVGFSLAPWVLLPAIATILAVLTQQSLVFTFDKLQPKLSRVSPFSIAKQKFGREGLFDFAKSMLKLLAISVILGRFLIRNLPHILGTVNLTPALVSAELLKLTLQFLLVITILSATIGALDFLWQRRQLLHRNRMSRQDMIDESRQSEGDPQMKQQRRQRAQAYAMNQMMLEVPRSDVVIVNPTHFAVALKWNRGDKHAPVCVAKGYDLAAARIREAASIGGVPIHHDPPTARAICATVDVGQEIRVDQYRAVAAAIRFSEKMRRRAKAGNEW